MNRRNMIKIIGIGAGSMALGSAITGCDGTEPAENFGWDGPNKDEKDIRIKVLSYAILCANPHNIQPWIVRITGTQSFDLYVDPERLLPETDPYYRQIHIGQGTFLETLVIAASGLGYEAKIKYFPEGMYANDELQEKPVASINLNPQPDISADPLFEHLLSRHSNKREYDNVPLSSDQVNSLQTFHARNNTSQLSIVDSPKAKHKMSEILTEAMQIEVGDRGRDMETIALFRFNSGEVRNFRDGFGVAQAGLSGLKKFIVEKLLLSRQGVEDDPTSFGEQSVDITKKAAQSTATFAWITTKGNSRLEQVMVGREYCRINLKTTAMGLAQHPMSQVLQEYEDMLPLQALFKSTFNIDAGDTVQMLFRLGVAEATPHGPRRLVSQLIREKSA